MQQPIKNNAQLDGVSCTVANCVYNNGNMMCCAPGIKIKSCDPIQQSGVTCETFEARAGQ